MIQDPHPVEPWSGVLNATEETKICYQLLSDSEKENEDCLYLNVYTPAVSLIKYSLNNVTDNFFHCSEKIQNLDLDILTKKKRNVLSESETANKMRERTERTIFILEAQHEETKLSIAGDGLLPWRWIHRREFVV